MFTLPTQISEMASMSMLQLEHDYQGSDYTINAKSINPSPVDLSGIYIGSYLQSVTPNLAIGVETLYHRVSRDMQSLATSYLAKYTGSAKNWIATAQLQPSGAFQATYWQKLSEKVDVAADLQLVVTPMKREGLATLGAKYDLRMATFRAQIDSQGKVSALLEQRFAPTFAFLVAGEIDHFRVCSAHTLLPVTMCLPLLPVFAPVTEQRESGSRCYDRELQLNTRRNGHASTARFLSPILPLTKRNVLSLCKSNSILICFHRDRMRTIHTIDILTSLMHLPSDISEYLLFIYFV